MTCWWSNELYNTGVLSDQRPKINSIEIEIGVKRFPELHKRFRSVVIKKGKAEEEAERKASR